jgi:putative redox protein
MAVTGKWTGGQQFLFADEVGHVVVTDSQGQGMKPPEMLLATVAGCAGVDVVRILEKKRKKITGIEVKVSKENDPNPPWCIEKIEIEWIIRGPNISQKAAEDAVHLAEEKYCSVTASLTSEIVTTVHAVRDDEAED